MTIEIFEVGGSIRDEMLGIENIPDRDFCVVSTGGWTDFSKWCDRNMDSVFQVKPEFFTIRGSIGTDVIDMVMCRKDSKSTNGRHPDSVEPGTLLDDLSRRDFTVNAMARKVDPKNLKPVGNIIDPFFGTEHAQCKKLSSVGDVDERFEEDGLRVIRAVRFCVTKDFIPDLSLRGALFNPHWWDHAKNTVSEDRIRVETDKMFRHDSIKSIRFLTNHCAHEALDCIFGGSSNIWLKPTTENK